MVSASRYYAALGKNGAAFKFGQVAHASSAAGITTVLAVEDVCNGTDFYELFFVGEGAGTKDIRGDVAFTYWSGRHFHA